jgi:hypothetical protein
MSTNVPLPAGTTLGKSYEYGLEVNIGTTESPVWVKFRRIFGFSVTPTPTTQEAQTYDDLGAVNSEVTGWSWTAAFSSYVNRSESTGAYLEEVEALRQRTLPSAKGEAAKIEVRWYHKPETGAPNPDDAGQGIATVSYTRSNTGAEGSNELWAWTLTGVGAYEEITNPWTGWEASVPTITSVLPSGATAGSLVTIKGTGFGGVTGADGVKFGTVNAAAYTVTNPNTIVASVPAGTAGSAPVTTKTPAGTSAAAPYTRGA